MVNQEAFSREILLWYVILFRLLVFNYQVLLLKGHCWEYEIGAEPKQYYTFSKLIWYIFIICMHVRTSKGPAKLRIIYNLSSGWNSINSPGIVT